MLTNTSRHRVKVGTVISAARRTMLIAAYVLIIPRTGLTQSDNGGNPEKRTWNRRSNRRRPCMDLFAMLRGSLWKTSESSS